MPFPTSAAARPIEDKLKLELSEHGPHALSNFPLMRGVVLWKQSLAAIHSHNASKQEHISPVIEELELFFKHMTVGLEKPLKKVTVSAPELQDKVAHALIEALLDKEVKATGRHDARMLDAILSDIPLYKALSKDEQALLQQCCEYYENLSQVDFEKTGKPLPGPGRLQPFSLIGRFIASDERPSLKAHHASLIGPFLRTLKNLSRFIEHPEKTITICHYDAQGLHGLKKNQVEELKVENYEQLLAGISKMHALQLFELKGSSYVVPVPTLPAFDLESLSREDLESLTTNFFDWFFGITDTIEFDTTVRKLEPLSPHDPELTPVTPSPVRTSVKKLGIKHDAEEAIQTWLSRAAVATEIEAFQRALSLRPENAKLVLTTLTQELDANSQSILWQLAAYGLTMNTQTSQGIAALHDTSFLIDKSTFELMKDHLPKTMAQKFVNTRSHKINIDTAIFNPSVNLFFPIEGLDDFDDDFEQEQEHEEESSLRPYQIHLVQVLLERLQSGVNDNPMSVFELLREECGKHITSEQLVEGVIEYIPTLRVEDIQGVIEVCREEHIYNLTEQFWNIAQKRAGLTQGQINIMQQSLREYQPTSYEASTEALIPSFAFEGLVSDPLWYAGWDRVADEFLLQLEQHEIICLVDDTNYHLPETLVQQQTSKSEDDVEDTFGSSDKMMAHNSSSSFASIELEANVFRKLNLGLVPDSFKDTNFFVLNARMSDLTQDEAAFVHALKTGSQSSRDQSITKDLLAFVASACPGAIISFNVAPDIDESQYSKFLHELKGLDLKLIVRTKKTISGLAEFRLQALGEPDLLEDLTLENAHMSFALGIQPLSADQITQITSTVYRQLPTNSDPMYHVKTIMRKVAAMTIGQGNTIVSNETLHEAIGQTFHLPSLRIVQQTCSRLAQFGQQVKTKIIGQDEALDRLVGLVIDHMIGARPDTSPLSIMLPGPTGVGKTETVTELMKYLGLEVMHINGSQYAEEHTVSRLSGSPTGYVGPDEGVLFTFLKHKPFGLVFIDEYDKLHPVVRKFLMELSDKGMMTAGSGAVVKCPGITVIAATNAGAMQLYPGMSDRDMFGVLSTALKNGGEDVPELVARFEVIPYFGIDEEALSSLVEQSFYLVNTLRFMSSRGINITDVDTTMKDLALERTKKICAMKEIAPRPIGFRDGSNEDTQRTPHQGVRYCNLRRVRGQVDQVMETALQEIKQLAICGELHDVNIRIFFDTQNDAVRWEKA
jgi:hypothetical protein